MLIKNLSILIHLRVRNESKSKLHLKGYARHMSKLVVVVESENFLSLIPSACFKKKERVFIRSVEIQRFLAS